MRRRLFLAPREKRVSQRRVPISKFISATLTMIVMTAGAILIAVAHKRIVVHHSRKSHETSLKEARGEPIPAGLGRKRPAFVKAIDILADGASTNPKLAAYNVSVTSRVNGESNPSLTKPILNTPEVQTDVRSPASSDVSFLNKRAYSQSVDLPDDEFRTGVNQFASADLDFEINPAIRQWLTYYSASPIGRRTMVIGIDRSTAYLEMARAEFRGAGIPEDLVWLAFVESVWNPRAISPAAAGGLWQFIPATAIDYGLKVQDGDDERNDPAKQTRVAAIYLRDLHTIFGNWELAMAAYNSGEPRVMGAIVKNGGADFWELYDKQLLPKETRDYVPKILASISIARNPGQYGLADATKTESGNGD